MDLTVKNLYPYRVKHCNTITEIDRALDWYEKLLEFPALLNGCHQHNIEELVYRLKAKRELFEPTDNSIPIPLAELNPARIKRMDAVIELVQMIPLFFQYKENSPDTDWSFVTRMFRIYLGVLQENNIGWNPKMYNNMVKFHNCGNRDEMIIYLLHEVITSGLHAPAQITKQINLLIKLVYVFKIESRIRVALPHPKDLEFKIELQDLEY